MSLGAGRQGRREGRAHLLLKEIQGPQLGRRAVWAGRHVHPQKCGYCR